MLFKVNLVHLLSMQFRFILQIYLFDLINHLGFFKVENLERRLKKSGSETTKHYLVKSRS